MVHVQWRSFGYYQEKARRTSVQPVLGWAVMVQPGSSGSAGRERHWRTWSSMLERPFTPISCSRPKPVLIDNGTAHSRIIQAQARGSDKSLHEIHGLIILQVMWRLARSVILRSSLHSGDV